MAKYTDKLAEKIVTLIEENNYTITEVCKALSISRKSFYEWRNLKPDFVCKLDEAMDRRDEKLMLDARKALQRKIDGYTLTEKKTTYIPDKDDPTLLKIKSVVVKEKEYAPDKDSINMIFKRYDERQDKKKELEKQVEPPLNIYVRDQNAADNIVTLVHRLQSGG